MTDRDIKYIHQKITTNNYLSNCYRNVTRSKVIHFIFILIETLLNILNILDFILNDFYIDKNDFEFVAPIPLLFKQFSDGTKLAIIILAVLIFDSMHIIFTLKDFKKEKIYTKIIINFLELFHFRVFVLLFFYQFFSLKENLFLIGLIFIIFHIYLIFNNFLYCHLYYFVPSFINYPFDSFSSLYDLILLYFKFISALTYYSNSKNAGKFYFIILLLSRIFCCAYFFEKSTNHSYLLMNNTFLNKTRYSSILIETIITIAALIVGKNEIKSVFFVLICISIFLIIVIYIHLLYNPYNYIRIESDRPNENLYFYFYILINGNSPEFLFEEKLRKHLDNCGYCVICKKFVSYLLKNHKLTDDEEKIYLNMDLNIGDDNSEMEFHSKNYQLNDLFQVVYDGSHNYFFLIKQISDDILYRKKQSFVNNIEYYFINLSFLIYSDYAKFNINLSLNEKIILEVMSKRLEVLDHQTKITQLLLCNKFIETCKRIINKIREILNSEQNFSRAKKLLDLSFLLHELKDNKYRYHLFTTKFENIISAKNLILICSIFYEEIFNTVLSNTQMPIRNNFQILEDTFINSFNKSDKKISLALSLNNKECKIIRAGKGLSSFLNENLFDLFPIEFKQYQTDLFTQSVLNNFNYIWEKEREKSREFGLNLGYSSFTQIKKKTRSFSGILTGSSIKLINLNTNLNKTRGKNKKELIKIEVIICQNIDSKIYYQLVTLKLTLLFNSDYNYFILLDGLCYIHKHTIITMVDHEQNHFAEETIFSISEPKLDLETEVLPISLKIYKKWLYDLGYTTSKVFSFNIYSKVYYVYMVIIKKRGINKKSERNITLIGDTKIYETDETDKEKSIKISKKSKVNYIEDTASFFSQQLINTIDKGNFGVGYKNKKMDETYQYTGFNKIRGIAYLVIGINIILIIIENIHLLSVEHGIEENNNTFLTYREFYKLYFQLFSMTLSIVCVDKDKSGCYNSISFYVKNYFDTHPEDKFDILSFLNIQNYQLSLELMEKRSIFNNVYKYIGPIKFNEIFRKSVRYLRINKSFVNSELEYSIIEFKEQFSELLLIMCNNFKYITSQNNSQLIIHLLNGFDNTFSNLNSISMNYTEEMDIYQQYIYELIINHKTFSDEFENINESLINMLQRREKNIKIFLHLYIILNIIIILIIEIIIYFYIGYFEKILIMILNIINMTLNDKMDDFQFSKKFGEKIDNLEYIINLSSESPKKFLININHIYNNYQQFLINKRRKEVRDAEKKGYKLKYEKLKLKDSEEVPKNQMILTSKNVRNLKILNKYFIIYFSLILIAICLYLFMIFFWNDYFDTEVNLYQLISKNTNLETAIYRAINLYYMIIFNNFTIYDATKILYPQIYDPVESPTIFNYIYSAMKLGFNSKIEINSLGKLYQDFGNSKNFTCAGLFQVEAKDLMDLYIREISSKDDIQKKLTNMCINFIGMDSDKALYIIQNHFQYIKNGIITIDNFSYDGLISHLKAGYIGRSSLFFNTIVTNLINIIYSKRHRIAIERLLKLLKNNIQLTGILFIVYDVVLTIVIIFFFIRKIKNYCNQIILLKKTFQITKFEI